MHSVCFGESQKHLPYVTLHFRNYSTTYVCDRIKLESAFHKETIHALLVTTP